MRRFSYQRMMRTFFLLFFFMKPVYIVLHIPVTVSALHNPWTDWSSANRGCYLLTSLLYYLSTDSCLDVRTNEALEYIWALGKDCITGRSGPHSVFYLWVYLIFLRCFPSLQRESLHSWTVKQNSSKVHSWERKQTDQDILGKVSSP